MAAVAVQRPLKGSRLSSFYPVKNLPSLASLDSAFQLQEYISLLIRLDVHDVEKIISIPGKPTTAQEAGSAPEEPKSDEKEAEKDHKGDIAVDEACWIYEQLRRLAQDLSHPLITMLQQECTRQSCPEMKAGEWLYLCVAHGNEGAMEQCCAIDYIIHTLDSATALLNSPRAFPSRLSIPASSYRHFSSLARRLGRIFAHAYFHHREAFEQAEAESSLYARFLTLTSKFDLVPSEFLVIPPRLGHIEDSGQSHEVEPPRLLAAAVDPQRERERDRERQESKGQQVEDFVLPIGRQSSYLDDGERRALSVSPGADSSRKLGRSRTDTMVFSEAVNIAEDLARMEESEPGTDSLASSNPSEPEILSIDSPVEAVEVETVPDTKEDHPVVSSEEKVASEEAMTDPGPLISSELAPHESSEPASDAAKIDEPPTPQPVEDHVGEKEPVIDNAPDEEPLDESPGPKSEDSEPVAVISSAETSESVPVEMAVEEADTPPSSSDDSPAKVEHVSTSPNVPGETEEEEEEEQDTDESPPSEVEEMTVESAVPPGDTVTAEARPPSPSHEVAGNAVEEPAAS